MERCIECIWLHQRLTSGLSVRCCCGSIFLDLDCLDHPLAEARQPAPVHTHPSFFFLSTHSHFLLFVAMPAPRIWSSLLASFPLVEYEEQLAQPSVEYPAAPSRPTLWIYGPGVGNSKESFDLQCLRAQAELAFNDIKVERRDMQVAEGSPGGELCCFSGLGGASL